jgi:D-amino-acid dehydrogenase
MPTVAVIGAGVIGLSCAWALRKQGADVLVLDPRAPGTACSAGNAGWIVPAMSGPIPAPGLVGTSLKWMLKRDSPLYIRPRVDPAFSAWLFRFWRNCRAQPYQAGLDAVASLNQRTMALFDELQADGVRFEMRCEGLLYAGLSQAAVTHAFEEVRLLERFGYQRPELLDGAGLRQLEPGLSRNVAGGFLVREERHVRPETLTAGLASWLAERDVDVRIGKAHAVIGAQRRGRGVRALVTRAGTVEADQFVLAAGAWSGPLARQLGCRLPVEAGKGYSVTVARDDAPLGRPIDLIEARVACTPFDGALRLAGTMELSGLNLRLAPERLAAIRHAGDQYLGDWRGGDEHAWVGMRPLTPDGLPLIGLLPGADNLYVATGHAMLGVTLAPATGEALARYMLGDVRASEAQLAPFDPGRFQRRQRRRTSRGGHETDKASV